MSVQKTRKRGKKTRKHGRSREKCAAYCARGQRERNKRRALQTHLRRHPGDGVAAAALARLAA